MKNSKRLFTLMILLAAFTFSANAAHTSFDKEATIKISMTPDPVDPRDPDNPGGDPNKPKDPDNDKYVI